MLTPDDSALLHASRYYDPQKAHEYYMRNRETKGRPRAAPEDVPVPRSGPTAEPAPKGRSKSSPAPKGRPRAEKAPPPSKTKREQLEAQKEMLEKRLDRLRDVLAQKVEAAKARSGVKNDPVDKDDTPAEKAAKNEANKKDTALTAKQKKEKADKAREEYKKEHRGDPSLSAEVAQLQRQITDIRARIQSAIEDARAKSAQSNSQTASNGR